ncbi:biotin--[acetyl-CoA-carboxylase] ligase [Paracoccus sp. TK19116]|uniref:biotin--[biotin carboxyl-carrier protein] ligase n=1 Tax=Paracoccus albicereus TaxID=2922394 RepID=A0ABT1MQ32_9RHOB|nr:biotin--[acetyl-CoA-carboxylase] ligase [Paracoccus albicereus]MCQ0969814.1 biotin--[acetyl-CoA-carboxylase] ligase [Paracoccus albicereus]
MTEAALSGALPLDWPAETGRIVLEECASTNAQALAMASDATQPTWILTHRQTEGRGRRGRGWLMPEGNFAATLLLPRPGSALIAAQLSFVAALAVDDALALVLGPAAAHRTAIKWPNDNLLDGGKIGGILLETSTRGTGIDAVAVGIGVNLAAAPDNAQLEDGAMPPVSLAEATGLTVTPEDFLDLLAPAFDRWLRLHRAEGFTRIRDAWLPRAARLGQDITARTGRDSLTGRFESIDETGAMILMTDAGRHVLPAADIHFGAA